MTCKLLVFLFLIYGYDLLEMWKCWGSSGTFSVSTENWVPVDRQLQKETPQTQVILEKEICHTHWQTVSVVAWKKKNPKNKTCPVRSHDCTAINDREQCLIDRKENKESETPAAIWRLWCPLCWLVPSEWVRSVTGFWTHSSFKRRTNKPQTFAMGKRKKAEKEINVYKKKKCKKWKPKGISMKTQHLRGKRAGRVRRPVVRQEG